MLLLTRRPEKMEAKMKMTMDHQPLDFAGIVIWCGAMLLNAAHAIDQGLTSFLLSSTATILAIIYYVIQIRKNLKKKNDEKIS